MAFRSARETLVLFGIAAVSAVAGGPRLAGQPAAPPRPNVAITRLPSMALGTIPVDVNNDGRADLVAGRPWMFGTPQPGGELVARLGNGDGTFGPERVIATPQAAAPLGAGDFNGDRHTDIVALDMRPDGQTPVARGLWILPGNGDGTFGAAVTVATYSFESFAWTPPISAVLEDFDGDSHLDLAVTNPSEGLHLYPGNGDFSFDGHVTLATGGLPMGSTSADWNADGRPDLAVAAREGRQVDVFVNQGGRVFSTVSILLDRAALDVAAADLNRDGRSDLVVAAATEDLDFRWTFHDGQVIVLLGNGNGSFQSPVRYNTPRGTNAVVSGDFNRDGLPDVAAANHTAGDVEECGPLWGSVSILPGNGGGTLGSAASFQFSYDPADDQFHTRIHSLAAARLDGDAHADLVASGAILLNRPEAANRAPSGSAGPDKALSDDGGVRLDGTAFDPDFDLLAYQWTDESGRVIERCLQPFVTSSGPGEHTYTMTISDGRGGMLTDSATVRDTNTHNAPELTIFRPAFGNPVPANAPYSIEWSVFDPDGGRIVDIDISVDRNGQTNFTPIPNCTNLPGTATACTWPDPGPPSNDAALLFRITDSQGDVLNTVARFQILQNPSGALPPGWSHADVGAVGSAGTAAYDGHAFTVRGSGADIWGTADEFHWAFRTATGNFEVVGRVATVQNVNPWTKAGLMIRESQAAGARHASIVATPGTQKPLSFQRRPATNGNTLQTAAASLSPPVWLMLRRTGDTIASFYRTTDTGAWIAVGSQTLTGLPQSVLVGLPVSSHVDGTPATASFGDVSVTSHAAAVVRVLRPARDEQVQINAAYTIRWMPEAGASAITRFDLFSSQDPNGPWSPIAECTNVTPDRRSCIWQRPSPLGEAYVRVLATTSAGVEEAISERFAIVLTASGHGGTPPGWSCGDVGAVGAAGSCGYQIDDELSPDFVISGSGADIWGTADEFSHASYAAYGDFSFTARVLNVENVNRWTKAGIMIRDTNGATPAGADDRHAAFLVTPTLERGTAFQRRAVEGGTTVHTAGPLTTAPVWLKLIRTGNSIRAYSRKEWTDPWTLVGEQVFGELPYQLSAMLVVSSHVDGALARASFDNVQIDERKPMSSADIGASAPGTTTSNGPETTIEGNGADIWGTSDAFRFHYTRWNGYGSIIVRVRSLEETNAWAKAGVMFRESLAPGARQVMAIVSPSRGIAMQSRSVTGGATVSTTPIAVNAPVWLSIRRFDNHFTAGWSVDGETWEFLGEVTIAMNAEVLVGLPVTSHAPGVLATALFDDFVIRP